VNAGILPPAASFLSVDVPNVQCSAFKPAEANGRGFILRFHETSGQAATAKIAMPCLFNITSAVETSLVEEDRPASLTVEEGNSFHVALRAFGVKTVRIVCGESPSAVSSLHAEATADMQVSLRWSCDLPHISHFKIYLDTRPDCPATLLNFVGQSATLTFVDQPRLNSGGWIRNRLDPETAYHYRVVPVDRWNNPGPAGMTAAATTLATVQSNLAPSRIEGLRAVDVSPISKFNFVNLLFRTACEPDVAAYEIHRSTRPDFHSDKETLIGKVNSAELIPGSTAYGHTSLDYRVNDFDHAMFFDRSVQPSTAYFYQVCAVDAAGQRGPCSQEVMAVTRAARSPLVKASASTVYAPEYGPEGAADQACAP
jgi:hypothetical protein